MTTQTSGHRQTWDMIPWLVNGSISALDRAQAEAHLAVCVDCRDELAFQSRLHAGLALGGGPPVPSCDAGLAKLMARIDGDEAQSGAGSGPPAQTPPKWLFRSLAAAVVLQAIGILALLRPWQDAAYPAYRTLSATGATPADAIVRFVPSPELPLAQLQHLLETHGLRIVDANESATIFALAPVPGRAGQEAAIDVTIAELRRTPGVLLVEPIGKAAAPR